MSVPQFGGWDHKVGDTDYSMVFSRARANKKQNKNDFNRHSIANEQELIVQKQTEHQPIQKQPEHQHDDSVVVRLHFQVSCILYFVYCIFQLLHYVYDDYVQR